MNFDVVIAGAGSAGAVVAARLSEQGRRVLLVEAGEDYRSSETPEAIRGANFAMALGSGRHHWPQLEAMVTEEQGSTPYLIGRGTGGSSAINGQGAARGCPADFDRWAQAGCTGWSWQDVFPAFVRLEHDCDFGDRPYHGTTGPIPVSRNQEGEWGPVSRALGDAAPHIGHPWSPDVNAPDSTGLSPIAWNRLNGARVSTNDAYLEPVRGRPNLTIQANTLLDRVIFAGGRVSGVKLNSCSGAGSSTVETGEVYLCAGAIHSPAILMRSGVGPAAALRALGIPIVADLPGVGRNLQDHPMIWLSFPLRSGVAGSGIDRLPGNCILRFSLDHDRTSPNELEIMPLDRTPMESGKGGLMISLMRPVSRGCISLQSADPVEQPIINFRMLSEHRDVVKMRNAMRYLAEVARTGALERVLDTGLCLTSDVQIEDTTGDELDRWLGQNCVPHFHAAGTCRMGAPDQPDTVVDSQGRVKGVHGLHVADASIMPELPTAALHLTTVMIAEHICAQVSESKV